MQLQIPALLAAEMRYGSVYHCSGEHIGLRPVSRVWFCFASGHYVADVGSGFMWSDGPNGPWHAVPGTAPCERRPRGADGQSTQREDGK